MVGTICSMFLLTILVAHLHIWASKLQLVFLTERQIIVSSSVNPILLRLVLRIGLAIDSILLKMEQLMWWLQSGHHAVSFFPLVAVTVSVKQLRKVHRTLSL